MVVLVVVLVVDFAGLIEDEDEDDAVNDYGRLLQQNLKRGCSLPTFDRAVRLDMPTTMFVMLWFSAAFLLR